MDDAGIENRRSPGYGPLSITQWPNNPTSDFLVFLSARFSSAVLAGFFFAAFFESMPLAILSAQLFRGVVTGITPIHG